MIYTFLISTVFIAEIIIAITIAANLVKLDKAILSLDETIELAKPKVQDLANLVKGISYQVKELVKDRVDTYNELRDEIMAKTFVKSVLVLLLWKMNVKAVNKFRQSKFAKTLSKGLSLLQIVV